LLGHRTTEDLPAEADIVVVGTGITGTSVARYLSEDDRAKGKSIVVLDAREACWCATGRVSLTTPREYCDMQLYTPERLSISQLRCAYLKACWNTSLTQPNRTAATANPSSGTAAPK
jgi:choline dehydrogenase-like flavoprotein